MWLLCIQLYVNTVTVMCVCVCVCKQLQCCGHTDYRDWFGIDWSEPPQPHGVPTSCCKTPNCDSSDLPEMADNSTLPVYANVSIYTKLRD